jgi:hypothetical protein
MTSHLRAFLLLVALPCAMPPVLFAQQDVRPPLHTGGYDILDAAGRRVRLTSVNWYGFDQKEFVAGGLDVAPLQVIVEQISAIGVIRCVCRGPTRRSREIPWS